MNYKTPWRAGWAGEATVEGGGYSMAGWSSRAPESARDPRALVVARDCDAGGRITKQFFVARDFVHYSSIVVGEGTRHLYEVIPCGRSTPVWFFADHDCYAAESGGMDPEEFAADVVGLHLDAFSLSREDIGKRVFVSSSSRAEKLSVHVVVRYPTTLSESRRIADTIRSSCADPRLFPDTQVYSSSLQQIRAIGSSKKGSVHAKLPMHEGPAVMHLVRIDPGDPRTAVVAPPVGLPAAFAERAVASVGGDIGHRPVGGDAVASARAALGSIERSSLGPAFDPATCIVDPIRGPASSAFSFYIDGSVARGGASVVCPIARRCHRSNRAIVEVRLTRPALFYKCLSRECRAVGFIPLAGRRRS